MTQRRVAVTGIGMISAVGHNLPKAWSAMCAGKSGIGAITSVDTSNLRFKNGAEVRNYDAGQHFQQTEIDLMDRFAQFGVIAARQAVADAGLDLNAELAGRTAVIAGSCIGGQSSQDAGFVSLYLNQLNRVHPLTIPRAMANAGASHISMQLGISGPTYTISTACSSANHAIGQAFWMVRNGLVEIAITGGSEAPFSFGILKAWEAMRVVSSDTCRPFCKERRGLILGEGAAMLVLEPVERALARGVRVYGEIAGFGMSSDAGHITAPSIAGPANAMNAALSDAGLQPREIAYVNAHGTGTPSNDVTETRAIRQVFGTYADQLCVSSTKAIHGHALGAAGALEAAATLMALYEQTIPPTVNFITADSECDLDVVPNHSRRKEIKHALSNSFAFGGLNAVLAFSAAPQRTDWS